MLLHDLRKTTRTIASGRTRVLLICVFRTYLTKFLTAPFIRTHPVSTSYRIRRKAMIVRYGASPPFPSLTSHEQPPEPGLLLSLGLQYATYDPRYTLSLLRRIWEVSDMTGG